jgi:cytochrome c peroxidase
MNTVRPIAALLRSFARTVACTGLLLAALHLSGCSTEPIEPSPYANIIDVPPGFPEQQFPADNVPNEDRILLGKVLFYSPLMSHDSDVACVNCHYPGASFTGQQTISPGTQGRLGTRNSPSLANVGYKPHLLMEGGVPTLEMQALVPVSEHSEFGMNVLDVVDRFKSNEVVQSLSMKAYGRPFDAYVLTRAIASFERTFVSGRSRVDRQKLSASELRGKELFFSNKTSCSSCHGGFLYTTHGFANNGAYASYADMGRAKLTGNQADKAVFAIPSLRNVGVTAPYMHDGRMETLAQVIEHYNRGGFDHPNKSPLIRPLGLSAQEQRDLEGFLHALTDEAFIYNPRFMR